MAEWSKALANMRGSEKWTRGWGVQISVGTNVFYPKDGAPCSFFLPKIGKTPADFKRNVSMYQILVNRYNQSVKKHEVGTNSLQTKIFW